MSIRTSLRFLVSILLLLTADIACGSQRSRLADITLPPDFSISVYAANVPGARSMTLGTNGTLFVGSRSEGMVYAFVDHNGDGTADEVITIAGGLRSPNGVALRDGALYVAEINRVIRLDAIETRLRNPPTAVDVTASFPDKSLHGWKFIRFGPFDRLNVPVGAPCNVCEEKDPRFASIMRMNPDDSSLEIFARRVRNTSASAGIPAVASSGLPTMAVTGWGTVSRLMYSIVRPGPVCTSGSLTCTGGTYTIPHMAKTGTRMDLSCRR